MWRRRSVGEGEMPERVDRGLVVGGCDRCSTSESMLARFTITRNPCRQVHIHPVPRQSFRKYLEGLCVWVVSNTTTLSILSSQTAICLGFVLIVSLFSWQRNIIQTFMYWQLLKLMYHAPATASYHQSMWTKIERTVNPLIHRHVPFLDTPLSTVQKWWLRSAWRRKSHA